MNSNAMCKGPLPTYVALDETILPKTLQLLWVVLWLLRQKIIMVITFEILSGSIAIGIN